MVRKSTQLITHVGKQGSMQSWTDEDILNVGMREGVSSSEDGTYVTPKKIELGTSQSESATRDSFFEHRAIPFV